MSQPTVRSEPQPGFLLELKNFFHPFILWLSEERFRPADLAILAAYWAAVWFGIRHHEPWSDEALPWVIARDTDWRGFLEVIFRNWDFHPGLFHALLIPFVKLHFPYFSQTVLNAAFALAAAGLFVIKAPFSRVFRAIFPFCFYMIYEYSVITRPYMLTVLLIFSLAAFYPKRKDHPYVFAFLISLLFHADYMGFGFAAALTLVFFVENGSSFGKKREFAAAFLWMALNGLLVLWVATSKPPGHATSDLKIVFDIQSVIRPLSNAILPFYDLGGHVFLKSLWAFVSGFAVLALVFASLARRPLMALIFAFSASFLFGVFTCFYLGDSRNHGFILISVIACLWIARSSYEGALPPPRPGGNMPRQWAERAAVALLGVSFLLNLSTVFAVFWLEYKLPFSGAKLMAEAIRRVDSEHGILGKGFVIVAPHKNSVGLMPYLPGVRFWNPCSGNYVEYYKATQVMKWCNKVPESEALAITRRHFGDLSRIVLLLRNPLPFSEDEDYRYQLVFSVPKAFGHWSETFFLYQPLAKKPSGTALH